MRKKNTNKRGWIGLIRKGSGHVTGAARLIDSLPAIRREDHQRHFMRHRVPADRNSGEYLHPWVLQTAFQLPRPVPYEHKSGAVIWVRFSDDVAREIWRQSLKSIRWRLILHDRPCWKSSSFQSRLTVALAKGA